MKKSFFKLFFNLPGPVLPGGGWNGRIGVWLIPMLKFFSTRLFLKQNSMADPFSLVPIPRKLLILSYCKFYIQGFWLANTCHVTVNQSQCSIVLINLRFLIKYCNVFVDVKLHDVIVCFDFALMILKYKQNNATLIIQTKETWLINEECGNR